MVSGNEIVDYSKAPYLGADQKTHGLWERDWVEEYESNADHSDVDSADFDSEELVNMW